MVNRWVEEKFIHWAGFSWSYQPDLENCWWPTNDNWNLLRSFKGLWYCELSRTLG